MAAPKTTPAAVTSPLGEMAALVDGGGMRCGSRLLLLITQAMRQLGADGVGTRLSLGASSSGCCSPRWWVS